MHLDVLREVAGEDLCNEEAIVEGASDVLDRVAEVEGLDPLEDLAGEPGGCRILRRHVNRCCHSIY